MSTSSDQDGTGIDGHRDHLDALPTGFQQLVGYRLVEWRKDHAVLELQLRPHHLNRTGVLHGGVVTTLIDVACGFSGCHSEDPEHPITAVTLNLTTSFTGQVRDGVVRAVARKRRGGNRIFFASAEVLDDQGEMIGFGDATYRYRSHSVGRAT